MRSVLTLALLGGAAVGLFWIIRRQYKQDKVFDTAPAGAGATSSAASTEEKRSISRELLEILADPADKGPVKLINDNDGKEWLLNPRNGYRYPVEDGIPIMLIEEGEKHKDEALIEK